LELQQKLQDQVSTLERNKQAELEAARAKLTEEREMELRRQLELQTEALEKRIWELERELSRSLDSELQAQNAKLMWVIDHLVRQLAEYKDDPY